MFEINYDGDDDFSARWADISPADMDTITNFIESLIGAPDTVV